MTRYGSCYFAFGMSRRRRNIRTQIYLRVTYIHTDIHVYIHKRTHTNIFSYDYLLLTFMSTDCIIVRCVWYDGQSEIFPSVVTKSSQPTDTSYFFFVFFVSLFLSRSFFYFSFFFFSCFLFSFFFFTENTFSPADMFLPIHSLLMRKSLSLGSLGI